MFQFIPPSNPPALIQVVTLYPQDSIPQEHNENFQEQVNIANRNLGEDSIPFKDKFTTINSYQGEINNQNNNQNIDIYIEDINSNFGDYSPQNAVTITHLITQIRGGEVREFQFSNEFSDENYEDQSPTLEIIPETSEDTQEVLSIPIEQINVVEILADHQEYDEKTQVVTAIGNVEMRFAEAVLTADRLQVNLISRMAVAQGEVGLRRGDQLLRGTRFEYFFVQDQGVVKNASGEIYQPTLGRDLSTTSLPSQQSGGNLSPYPLSDRLLANQPLARITSNEGYTLTVGSGQDLGLVEGKSTVGGGGQINRYRFEAEEIEFDELGWDGKNVRITNDPFSPPELEIRADTAHYEETEPLVGVLTTTNSRVVFDQGLSLPIFQDRLVFDRRPQDPGLFSIGIDGENRGGIFIERSFTIIDTNQVNFRVTPQYFVQKSLFPGFLNLSPNNLDDEGIFSPSVFGLKLEADANIDSRTDFRGTAIFTSLDFNEIEDKTEANLRFMHKIGDLNAPHNLSLEYNYRDRLFNGSLGFQRVQSSLGLLIASPNILLGETGINLRYQGSIQNINSDTDRLDLLSINRENNRVNLTRYQGAATLTRGFTIWRGEGLPPTPTEGLKYTPSLIIPYLRVNTGIIGVSSLYSNGDTQQSVNGNIGLSGQLGNFSRSFLDYTGFNINYSQVLAGSESPFFFDRIADVKVLSWGITQQIYGPFRFGFQTALNLDTNKEISTDYILEYSRRTHNISLRYNPVLQLGALTFRIGDFNWIGSADPFDGETVGEITDGVRW
jgi:hypothetical protein